MEINYDELARQEFTIAAPSDGTEHTYKLRRMDALMQLTLPRQMTKAYERVTGEQPKDDATVQRWFSDWSDTPDGTAFCLDTAFEPLAGSKPLGDVMRQGTLGADDLAKVIYGMHSFFSSVTGSSSPRTGTAKSSAKQPARSRRGGQTMAVPSKNGRRSSR
jgi:hypothetical protein